MKLSHYQTFLNTKTSKSIIPTNGPLPTTLLPMSITSAFDRDVLASVFPWKMFLIVDWLRHVTDPEVAAANAEFDVTKSTLWAEQVLSVLARGWPLLAQTAKEDVIRMLSQKSCVPTSTGLESTKPGLLPLREVIPKSSHRLQRHPELIVVRAATWRRFL